MSYHKNRTQLRVESLETRMMLDGNVTASVVGDTLQIRGDSRANEIEIEVATAPDSTGNDVVSYLVVKGTDGNTTINGLTEFSVAASEVENLVVDLKNGNNDLRIGMSAEEELPPADPPVPGGEAGDQNDSAPMALLGNLTIKTGSGNDTIELENLQIGGNLGIATGNKVDEVQIEGVSVDGNVGIATGSGVDMVDIFGLAVEGNCTIDNGQGDDEITISDGTDDEPGELVTEVLNTFAGALAIRTGTGDDTVHLDHVQATDFVLDLAQGNDWLYLDGDNQFTGDVVLRGGPNKDTIRQADAGNNTFTNNFANTPLLAGIEEAGGLAGTIVSWNGRGRLRQRLR